jgi:PhnB protein
MTIQGSNILAGFGIAPKIIVEDVESAVDFYQKAFGAEVIIRETKSQGSIAYARLTMGNSSVLVSKQEGSQDDFRTGSPSMLGGTSVILELFVDDFDAALERAVLAGGKVSTAPIVGPCVGDRVSAIADPFGHIWMLSTFINDAGALCL